MRKNAKVNDFDFDEDEFEMLSQQHYKDKEQALKRRKNNIKKKHRLICISKSYGRSFCYPNEENTYIRRPKNSNMQQYLKTQTHRRNRRAIISEDECGLKGNRYRRALDYRWELD